MRPCVQFALQQPYFAHFSACFPFTWYNADLFVYLCMRACNPGLYELLFEGNLGLMSQVLQLELYQILEIKTFGLVPEFEMFLQPQQLSFMFMLL